MIGGDKYGNLYLIDGDAMGRLDTGGAAAGLPGDTHLDL